MGVISFAAFRPHDGRDADLLEVIGGRLPLLRRLGLATEREHIVVRTPSGIIMEVSEWVNKAAIDAAHRTPEVLELWKRFDDCSQYVTPDDANEFEQMFPTFPAVVAEPGVRLVAWGNAGNAKAAGAKMGKGKGAKGGAGKASTTGAGASEKVRALVDALRVSSKGTRAKGSASGAGRQGVVTGTASAVLTTTTGVGRALGQDVYRVDLAHVASKFIGETEKNLSRALRAAEGADAVLLFDEADALFEKRTSVRDSHDRYADLEVSYLLQKLEEHRGVVVFGARKRSSLDEAFMRRMRMMVELM